MPATPHLGAPIRDVADLRRHFQNGEKPGGLRRLGVEHEKIVVLPDGGAPAYEQGIGRLLERLIDEGGWSPVTEEGRVIGLRRLAEAGLDAVSLEPGGQFELSDAPRTSARAVQAAVRAHLRELAPAVRDLSFRFLGIGFRPFGTLDEVPWMPKNRYRLMRAYLPSRGAMSHEMMKRTATVQVNMDYEDEADCAEKMRVAMGTSSLLTALWAASPLVDGRATDFQSYRAACWLATDDDRCGLLPFALAAGSAERLYADYVEWALDVPMFFVQRQGAYRPAGGFTFRRLLAEGFWGEPASSADWELHLSTLFPEVRLKQCLELRGADAGPLPLVDALPALCRGLLYEPEARAAAWALVSDWSFEERLALRRAVPREGLRARVRREPILGRCRELVAIAREGLRRLGADDDAALLQPVEEIAANGRTTADAIRDLYARADGDQSAIAAALTIPLD